MRVKILVMDVDGTLTDGKIYVGSQGEMFKAFDIKDGYGIANILPKLGITPVIITVRQSNILKKRCDELGIKYLFQGEWDKKAKLVRLLDEFGILPEEAAYIGDDVVDLECMKLCGVKGAPADAVPEVKGICDFVSEKPGGAGAVRDFIEYLKGKCNVQVM